MGDLVGALAWFRIRLATGSVRMTDESARLNAILEREAPIVARCLSELGRRAAFPKGIPYQSVAARGTEYNATIGQVTNGAGAPLVLPELADVSRSLDEKISFLYSPQSGQVPIRQAWKHRQRKKSIGCTVETSTPMVTHGLTHGVSIVAEMFADRGTPILIPMPYWENYNLLFSLRVGADIRPFPMFKDAQFDLPGFERALGQLQGQKAILVLNFPQNPTGYSPTLEEAQQLVELISRQAGPLVVLCDDAYSGMSYDDGLMERSIFWDLLEKTDRERVLPIRADGVTKELLFYSARVGFLTHPYTGDVEAALESKMKCLGRGSAGSPSGPSQAMVLHALQQPNTERSIEARLSLLTERYHVLQGALEAITSDRIVPFPFNSGSFALLGIDASIDVEALRVRLIEHSVGVIAVPEVNAIRIAYCSMSAEALPALVERIEAVVESF